MGYIIYSCGHGLAHNKRAFSGRCGEKLDHRARVGHEAVRSRAVEIGVGRYILRAVCDILRSVPKLLIGQRSIKAEHDYIGVFFNKIDARSFEIAGQSLVAEKIDALAGAVSLEEVYSEIMTRFSSTGKPILASLSLHEATLFDELFVKK